LKFDALFAPYAGKGSCRSHFFTQHAELRLLFMEEAVFAVAFSSLSDT
jgi:hypothetical protein